VCETQIEQQQATTTNPGAQFLYQLLRWSTRLCASLKGCCDSCLVKYERTQPSSGRPWMVDASASHT
jgi:hypothetical protein